MLVSSKHMTVRPNAGGLSDNTSTMLSASWIGHRNSNPVIESRSSQQHVSCSKFFGMYRLISPAFNSMLHNNDYVA